MGIVIKTAEDIEGHYEGFSNGTLWPLYHDVIVKPIYHRQWWDTYVEVNRRFAEATAKSALRAVGSQLGRQLVRGVLGSLLGGRR